MALTESSPRLWPVRDRVWRSEDPRSGATAGGLKSEHEAGHHQCDVAEL